ncbi:hypothetical protein C2G38_2067170 [Gigaspora rosea]|uniref:Secreted protein n=1 Tax=Gigaspora rosea TaxID=44941 RepID=A0A397VUA9_9GLOM|nr:hypothetical protein C2G38_2067170 [Gigaspora rosea]
MFLIMFLMFLNVSQCFNNWKNSSIFIIKKCIVALLKPRNNYLLHFFCGYERKKKKISKIINNNNSNNNINNIENQN